MATVAKWYTKAIQDFIKGTMSWKLSGGSTIKCALIKNTYTPDQDTHEFWSDVSAHEVAASGSYASGGLAVTPADPTVDTATNRTYMDCSDMQATGFTGTARFAVFYVDTGTPSTSRLIGYHDFQEDINSNRFI